MLLWCLMTRWKQNWLLGIVETLIIDLLLHFADRTPTNASYKILVLGKLTHLARTRPRFILFTSSHDLLVSFPDVESGNETRIYGGRCHVI